MTLKAQFILFFVYQRVRGKGKGVACFLPEKMGRHKGGF